LVAGVQVTVTWPQPFPFPVVGLMLPPGFVEKLTVEPSAAVPEKETVDPNH
jgi:hypothetical protein